MGNIKANEFHITEKPDAPVIYDGLYRKGQAILNNCLQNDTWRFRKLAELKKKFWKSGFATYEDIEYLSCKLLRNNPDIAACLAKRFPLVIVDECQDLSFSQLQILYALHTHGTKLHFIGDLDQSIYKFRNIDPIETKGFIEQIAMKELPLAENYRSCQAIVDASLAVLCKPKKFAVGQIEQKVGVPLVALLYQQGQEQQVLKIFETLVNESQLSLENSRVIVRNNNLREKLLGRKFSSLLAINTIEEYARFLYLNSADSSVNSFQAAIRILARALQRTFFSESVHSGFNQLSKPDELDGRQWRTIINGVRKQLLSQEVLFNFGITWSQWKVNLKPVLENLTTGIPLLYDRPVNLGRIRPGESKRVVLEAFENTRNDSIPCDIETIHSCKGMSLDAVLFMSTYKQSHEQESGSHWYDWFASASNAINEGNRLAYVAFSRTRHLLVLGIPNPPSSKLNSSQLQLLVQAGFRIETINERI